MKSLTPTPSSIGRKASRLLINLDKDLRGTERRGFNLQAAIDDCLQRMTTDITAWRVLRSFLTELEQSARRARTTNPDPLGERLRWQGTKMTDNPDAIMRRLNELAEEAARLAPVAEAEQVTGDAAIPQLRAHVRFE